jgi:2-iminobutanoate/2-iminopropanoate deaminase
MTKHVILTPEAPAPIGPYSQAVLAGDTLYVSGQIALDPETGELVMKNMEAVLRAAGFGFAQVVKCTIFIRDMGQFGAINEAYGQYFKSDPPARETVEVSKLPKNVQVEISCIAVR